MFRQTLVVLLKFSEPQELKQIYPLTGADPGGVNGVANHPPFWLLFFLLINKLNLQVIII